MWFVGFLFFISPISAQKNQSVWKWKIKTPANASIVKIGEGLAIYSYSPNSKAEDSIIAAFDVETGKEKWKFAAKGSVFYGEMADGILYFDVAETIFALDAQSGKVLWKYDFGNFVGASVSEIKIKDGNFYALGDEIGLLAFDARTGKKIWNFRGCFNFSNFNFYANDKIMFPNETVVGAPCDSGVIFYLNRKNGELINTKSYRTTEISDVLTDENNSYVFGIVNESLFFIQSFNNKSFEENWSYFPKINSSNGEDQLFLNADKLFIRFGAGGLVAVDKKKGKEVWTTDTEHQNLVIEDEDGVLSRVSTQLKRLVIDKKAIYGVGDIGEIASLDVANGKTNWKITLSKSALGKPQISGNQLITSDEGFVYSIDLLTGKTNWKIKAFASSEMVIDENENLYFIANYRDLVGGINLKRKAAVGKQKTIATIPRSKEVENRTENILKMSESLLLDYRTSDIVSDASNEKGFYTKTNPRQKNDGGLYQIDFKTGATKQITKISASSLTAPAIEKGTAFFGATDADYPAVYNGDERLKIDLKTPAKFYALDTATGEILWERKTGSVVRIAPFIYNRTVYFVEAIGRLSAIDAKSGELKWTQAVATTTEKDLLTANEIFLTFSDDKIFVSSPMPAILAIDAKNGEFIWTKTTDAVFSNAVADKDYVYFGTDDGDLFALNKTDGTTHWHRTVNSDVRKLKIAEDLILAEGYSRITVIDKDAKVFWERNFQYSQIPVYHNGELVYFTNGSVYDLRSGERKQMKKELADLDYSELLFINGDLAVFKGNESKIYGYDLKNKKSLWEINL